MPKREFSEIMVLHMSVAEYYGVSQVFLNAM